MSQIDPEATREELEEQLGEVFTPHAPISDIKLYSGRNEALSEGRTARDKSGMHLVIYGPRGIGKTSFGKMLFGDRVLDHWYTGTNDVDFVAIFLTVLLRVNGAFTPAERSDLARLAGKLGVDKIASVEGTSELSTKDVVIAATKLDLNTVLDRVHQHQDQIKSIVIDEFDRIQNPRLREQIVHVIKGLSDRKCAVTMAILGTAESDRKLVRNAEYDEYLGRNVTPIELGPLGQQDVRDVFSRRSQLFGLSCPDAVSDTISWISCGYPHLVQLFGLHCASSWIERKLITDLIPWISQTSVVKSLLGRFRIKVPVLKVANVGISIEECDLKAAAKKFVDRYRTNFPSAEPALEQLSASEMAVMVDSAPLLMSARSECLLLDASVAKRLGEILRPEGQGFVAAIPDLGAFVRARHHCCL
jgi:hypothetical protein